jgi:xanthine dehydrogenase small subunit
METQTIRFIRRGEPITLGNVPPDRTLLEVLREDLGACGTKEGCGEGDCGACTVVVAEPEGAGLRYRAINSCIRLAHSVDGLALWTVEDLAQADGTLHPAQESMVQCHGSQCGFCTPGFVMSLFGMYQNHVRAGREITRHLAQADLSGNLCRCTGYRPILEAAQRMAHLPARPIDEADLVAKLTALRAQAPSISASGYQMPTTLPELLALRRDHPGAQVVAGCTDVGLWVTKQHRRLPQVLDVTRVRELRQIETGRGHLSIGAAVPLADAFAALVAQRPSLAAFAERFAGLPVRNSGTLGGNVANGSPIGDSMPLLIALDTRIVLASARGARSLALEDFYTGYRQTALAADEVVVRLDVPLPAPDEFLRVYKISKRYDDDISAVCLAIRMHRAGDTITGVRIGAGGVAATPARARQAEAAIEGQGWSEAAAEAAANALRTQFQPISDMRASAAYRREVLGNLMRRFWLESQGVSDLNLERYALAQLMP